MLKLTILTLFAASTAHAADAYLPVQGRLLDSSGGAITGTHSARISLYSDPDGAADVWRKVYASTEFSGGYFAVGLAGNDDSTRDLATALTSGDLWVGIAIDGPVDLLPIQRVGSGTSAYSFDGNFTVTGSTVSVDAAAMVASLQAELDQIYTSLPPTQTGPAAPFSAVFSTCGQTGREGPTQEECDTTYASFGPTVTVNSGIQSWTVPASGTYTITAMGAQGAETGTSFKGGRGAILRGNFALTAGDVLDILVGQAGVGNDEHGNENGGGGGTFVVRASDDTPLLVAGGGGGAPSKGYGTSCGRTNGDAKAGPDGGTVDCNGTGAGGTGGSGGGNNPGVSHHGAGGGGFTGNGADGGNHCGPVFGGKSYLNGALGGAGSGTCYATGGPQPDGGFGGGGAGQLGSPGGGGGYSGGGSAGEWSSHSDWGGGGGSYNIGTQGAFLGSTHSSDGSVTIIASGDLTPAPAYAATFTNCGQSGMSGPSQAQCNAAYGGSPTVTVLGGIQTWTAPADGAYTITAYGAQGAQTGTSYAGGRGAGQSGDFYLHAGDELRLLVGQQGTGNDEHGNENGGGGGSFVVFEDGTPLLIAGGGGGAPSTGYGGSCANTSGDGQAGTSGGSTNCYGPGAGGSGGHGGRVNTSSHHGTGGGGFFSAGANGGTHCGVVYGGNSFQGGGAGGAGTGTCYPSGGPLPDGGFGGGGAGQLGSAGGGGGYSGGGSSGEWSSHSDWAGGGGSLNLGANAQFLGATRTGHGEITIVNKQ